MVFGGVKAWIFKKFTAPIKAELAPVAQALIESQAAQSKAILEAQAIQAKALQEGQLATAKTILEYLNTNFSTKKELEERIKASEEGTDEHINEQLNNAPRAQYWSNKEGRELKDEAIITKAMSLGVPVAMAQMLLGRIKSEFRAEYNSLTVDAITNMSTEQIQEFINRFTGKGGQKQPEMNLKMYG